MGWVMYHTTNKGALVAGVAAPEEVTLPSDPNLPGAINQSWLQAHAPGWTRYIGYRPNDAPLSRQFWAIKSGALYKYALMAEIYRCPRTRKNETRSYSTNQGACGYTDGTFDGGNKWTDWVARRIDQMKNPSGRMVFVDDFPENWDACWMLSPVAPDRWWNPLSLRHDMGTTLSFADGHSERWRWTDPRTQKFATISWNDWFAGEGSTAKADGGDNLDRRRLQIACWGRLGY